MSKEIYQSFSKHWLFRGHAYLQALLGVLYYILVIIDWKTERQFIIQVVSVTVWWAIVWFNIYHDWKKDNTYERRRQEQIKQEQQALEDMNNLYAAMLAMDEDSEFAFVINKQREKTRVKFKVIDIVTEGDEVKTIR